MKIRTLGAAFAALFLCTQANAETGASVIRNATAPAPPVCSFTTWSPTDKATNINTSNGDLTVTSTSNSDGSIRSAAAVTTGTYRFEVTINTFVGSGPRIGIANSGYAITGGGGGGGSVAISANGDVQRSFVNQGNAGFTYTAGDTIGVEYDSSTNLVYFLKGATRSAGFSATGINPTYALWGQTDSGNISTGNFGCSSWQTTVTPGYVGWS